MTTDSATKKSVRLFQELNELPYTGALRQFEDGEPAYLKNTKRMTSAQQDDLESVWASRYGLTSTASFLCFHQLGNASGRMSPNHLHKLPRDCDMRSGSDRRIIDHARKYMFRGPEDARTRFGVLTFAPYLRWDDPNLASEVEAITSTYDLRVRVGFADDNSYALGTVPIVFWNPRVISLD